jgi:hypothetical protein
VQRRRPRLAARELLEDVPDIGFQTIVHDASPTAQPMRFALRNLLVISPGQTIVDRYAKTA